MQCRWVVVASGACNLPIVPLLDRCRRGSNSSHRLTTATRRSRGGGVLVVGASATGVQLADGIQRSGRPVTLSVGEHVRLPRTYRGRDVLWWMEASGVWNRRSTRSTIWRARGGSHPRSSSELPAGRRSISMRSAHRSRAGRALAAVRDGRALFSGGLRNLFSLADLKMERLLDTFDEWAREKRADAEVGAPERFAPTRMPESSRLQIDLAKRRDRVNCVGDRVSARLQLAEGAGRGRERLPAARRGSGSTPRDVHARASRAGGANRASSTAPKTKRREVIDHLAGYLASR